MNLATDEGFLNLAGVLMFAERPEWIKPQFVVKAIRYPGNAIHVSTYLDTEDFEGPFQKVFADALGFIMRNLHKVQAGRGVNAPGTPEIPESVFEELLVNALVHRDYLVNAPIRLFLFDDRIEIISPGHLPNNLTVEKIRAGNSNIRNPILVSYVAKGLLPYHGLGSGIKRALEEWPEINFNNDHEGCLFHVTVTRKPVEELDLVEGYASINAPISADAPVNMLEDAPIIEDIAANTPAKTLAGASISADSPVAAPINASISNLQGQILQFIRSNSRISYDHLTVLTQKDRTTVMRNIAKLKAEGILRRIGSKKTGHWEIIE